MSDNTVMSSFESPQEQPESIPDPEVETSEKSVVEVRKSKQTPTRLKLAIEANLLPMVGDIKVSGTEHIQELKEGEKVVIATTHISDLDIPLTIKALADEFDIAVSDDSTHHSFREDPAGNFSIRVAGQDNFIPIDYKKTDSGKQARFNVDNFAPMAEALESGKDVIVAAHNPSDRGELESGGIGAVYLAQISGAAVLPVAVKMEGEAFRAGKNALKTMKERPDAGVIVGSPIHLEPIVGINRYKEILDKRKSGILDKAEITEFKALTERLREQSEVVMMALSEMLNSRGF